MAKVRDDIETLIADGETLIKDGLRGARHVLRRGTVRAAGDPVSRGVSSLARKVDGVFSLAERTALSLLRPDAPSGTETALVANFAGMLAEDEQGFARRFVDTHYRLAKATLAHWGLRNALVSEQEIRLAFQILVGRDSDLVAGLRASARDGDAGARRRGATLLAAAAALAIGRREPVRLLGAPLAGAADGDRDEDRVGVPGFVAEAPSQAVFLAVALAVAGYAGRVSPEADPGAFLASAATIVEARWQRFSACRTAAGLAAEFDRVIPAMP